MKRVFALVLALPFVLMNAGPAAASQVISDTGVHGNVWLDDTVDTPGGTCSYGDVVYSNWAYLISMKVQPPHVLAADLKPSERDQRMVSWQWKLQRKEHDATTWVSIKSSGIQHRTAYEDEEADFTALKINYNSEQEDPTHDNSGPSVEYRAKVVVRWYKNNGSVQGTVKLAPDYYKINTYWDRPPNSGGYCQRIDTDG